MSVRTKIVVLILIPVGFALGLGLMGWKSVNDINSTTKRLLQGQYLPLLESQSQVSQILSDLATAQQDIHKAVVLEKTMLPNPKNTKQSVKSISNGLWLRPKP